MKKPDSDIFQYMKSKFYAAAAVLGGVGSFADWSMRRLVVASWDRTGEELVIYFNPVLWIRCVYQGSWIWIFSIPDPGSTSKNLSILTPKIVSTLSEIWSGLFNPDPGSGSCFFTHPWSRGQKGTGSRIRIRNTALINFILKAGRVSILYFITEIWFLTQIIYSKETTT